MKDTSINGYSIRMYQLEDEGKLLDFLSQVLQGWAAYSDKGALWRWKHFANPFGSSYVCVACNDREDIIGALAFMRWRLRLGHRIIQCFRVTDMATHPDYRRMGIALSLRRHLMEIAQRDEDIPIFNTPNQYSLPISLQTGSRLAGNIRLLIRVLNYRRFVMGLIRNRFNKWSSPQYQPQDFFRQGPLPVSKLLERREELERLLEQDQQFQNKTFRTERSWEYLQWRYARDPHTTYYAMHKEHQGELAGCAIFRADTYHSLKGIVINELLLGTPEEQLVSDLLNQLDSILNVDYVITYFSRGSVQREVLNRKGFLKIPRRAYNLTIYAWHPEFGDAPFSLDNWGLTPGELEEAWAWR